MMYGFWYILYNREEEAQGQNLWGYQDWKKNFSGKRVTKRHCGEKEYQKYQMSKVEKGGWGHWTIHWIWWLDVLGKLCYREVSGVLRQKFHSALKSDCKLGWGNIVLSVITAVHCSSQVLCFEQRRGSHGGGVWALCIKKRAEALERGRRCKHGKRMDQVFTGKCEWSDNELRRRIKLSKRRQHFWEWEKKGIADSGLDKFASRDVEKINFW